MSMNRSSHRSVMGHCQNASMHPSNDVGIRSEIMRKADLCAAALLEAERVSGAAMLDMLFARLMSKITDMLEELDEELLRLDHTRDRGTFERVSALHRGFERLQLRKASLVAQVSGPSV